MKTIQQLYPAILAFLLLAGCDEHGDPQGKIELSEKQTASVEMRGQWAKAADASLPFGTTPGVLKDLMLEFRTDDDYNPSAFVAKGAPYFFQGEGGTWSWADESLTEIELHNILPVTRIKIVDEGNEIRLTFMYEGPAGGKVGEYGVTLQKIGP